MGLLSTGGDGGSADSDIENDAPEGANPIEFGRAAARNQFDLKGDLLPISLGLIFAQFFGDLAELVGALWNQLLVEPITLASFHLSDFFDGVVFIGTDILPAAMRDTEVAILGLELGPFQILAGVAITLTFAFILALGRDFAQ